MDFKERWAVKNKVTSVLYRTLVLCCRYNLYIWLSQWLHVCKWHLHSTVMEHYSDAKCFFFDFWTQWDKNLYWTIIPLHTSQFYLMQKVPKNKMAPKIWAWHLHSSVMEHYSDVKYFFFDFWTQWDKSV